MPRPTKVAINQSKGRVTALKNITDINNNKTKDVKIRSDADFQDSR